MAVIANLVAKFSADTKGFTRGTSAVSSGISRLAGAAVAAAGTVGIGAITMSALEAADKINKLSDATGISTEDLSALKFIAEQTGSDLDTVAKAVSKMQKIIADAGDEDKTAVDALEKLGTSYEKLKDLAPMEQFRAIIAGFENIENQAEFTQVGLDVFGKSFIKMANLVKGGTAGLDALMAQFAEHGHVLTKEQANLASQTLDALNLLKTAWAALGTEMALRFAPAIKRVAQLMTDVMGRAVNNLYRGLQSLAVIMGAIVDYWLQISRGNFIQAHIGVGGNLVDALQELWKSPPQTGKEKAPLRTLEQINQQGNKFLQQIAVDIRRQSDYAGGLAP